jgi:small basic protein
MHLIFVLAILLIIGLIAGIILIKTSVKHISKSYFACLDMIFARLQIEIEKEIEEEEKANNQKKSNISKS